MSRVRSKWTKPEKLIHNHLKGRKIKHKMHPKMMGNPDILIPDLKRVIFIHGCFWHKCPKCYKPPETRKEYWIEKVEKNAARDKKNEKLLLKEGWKVVKIWEHEIRENFQNAFNKLIG